MRSVHVFSCFGGCSGCSGCGDNGGSTSLDDAACHGGGVARRPLDSVHCVPNARQAAQNKTISQSQEKVFQNINTAGSDST